MGTQCICYLYANVHSACQGLANYYCTAISQVYGRGRGGHVNHPTHSYGGGEKKRGEEEVKVEGDGREEGRAEHKEVKKPFRRLHCLP